MGPIHALCLQLLASGIIEFNLSEEISAGKNDVCADNVIIEFGKREGEPVALIDSYWSCINVSRDEVTE